MLVISVDYLSHYRSGKCLYHTACVPGTHWFPIVIPTAFPGNTAYRYVSVVVRIEMVIFDCKRSFIAIPQRISIKFFFLCQFLPCACQENCSRLLQSILLSVPIALRLLQSLLLSGHYGPVTRTY